MCNSIGSFSNLFLPRTWSRQRMWTCVSPGSSVHGGLTGKSSCLGHTAWLNTLTP